MSVRIVILKSILHYDPRSYDVFLHIALRRGKILAHTLATRTIFGLHKYLMFITWLIFLCPLA